MRSESSTWQGDGIAREVFRFDSAGDELYGSLYMTAPAEISLVFVICPAWGAEARLSEAMVRVLARGIASLGGAAALVFDWPGHGDSDGAPDEVDFPRLVGATGDAIGVVRERFSGARLGLAGVRFGGAVALLTDEQPSILVLLQPALDPAAHVEEMDAAGDRARLGRKAASGWAFGHPLPDISDLPPAERLRGLARAYAGEGVVVGYGSVPAPGPGFEEITVQGDWRRGARLKDTRLADLALAWLREKVASS